MGKSSKNKSKKLAKQERVGHLKQVEECESSFSLFVGQKVKSMGFSRNREVCMIYNQHIKLTLQSRQAFVALRKPEAFTCMLSGSYAGLLVRQILSQNYVEGLESLTNLMKIPKLETSLKLSVELFKDIFLLRLEGLNYDRIQRIIQNVVDFTDIVRANQNPLENIFVGRALFELSRLQLFEAVQYLSDGILQKLKDVPLRNDYGQMKMFFAYSNIDRLRHAMVHEEEVSPMLDTIQTLNSNRTLLLGLFNGTGYLAASLHSFYRFFCDKEELSPETSDEVDNYIKMIEVYVSYKSSKLNMICYTCNDEDTKDHQVFVCQGCRVACYCCKDHQRLTYLHHEDTGTRGLGHKHLCPVFKTFRKMKDNTDRSKDCHLERKFQRACKRFLSSTLKKNWYQKNIGVKE